MSVSESTGKPTIVYDGECKFCIARVNNIRTMDKNHRFAYMPRQDERSEMEFPQIKHISLEDGLLLIDPSDSKVYVAADAFYHIARHIPGWLGSVSWLYLVPGIKQIIQLGYKVIAMNRRRLGKTCHNGACRLD